MRISSRPLAKEQQFPGFVYMADNQPLTYVVPPSSGLQEIKWGIEQSQVSISEPNPKLVPAGFLEGSARVIREHAKLLVPATDFQNAETTLCYYTTTPDSKHVVQKFDPEGKITLVSACSGHGFKYAPAIAENIVKDLQVAN
jgi:sarcosine oxidase